MSSLRATDLKNCFVIFWTMILISVHANTRIKSERDVYKIEDAYVYTVYKAEPTQSYLCDKMAQLRRVPLCNRLYEQPHYKNDVKICFNFEAYRSNKPTCEEQVLTFKTQPRYNGIKQRMLLCPGRHDPIRSHWLLDDYRDVFYVSDGPEPDSLVVFRRERDADREWFVVYEILKHVSFKTLGFAIVTPYDTEKELEALRTIAYNNEKAELETIYILEMYKTRDRRRERDWLLSNADTITELNEYEFVTLCYIIFDRDDYKKIGFWPRQPTQKTDKPVGPPKKNSIYFQHAIKYNENGITQSMYRCHPRAEQRSLRRVTDTDRYRVHISSGARANSFFVYLIDRDRGNDVYTIHEFVENVNVDRETMSHYGSKFSLEEAERTSSSSTLPNRQFVERQYVDRVINNLKKGDVVCDSLYPEQLVTLCLRLYQKSHYANNVQIHFNYRAALYTLRSCTQQSLVFDTYELRPLQFNQRMVVCPGRHDPRRSDWYLDDYKDVFHISGGLDSKSVTVYRRERDTNTDWIRVYDIQEFDVNLIKLSPTKITYEDIRAEHVRSMWWSFNDDEIELEIIYIREMVKQPLAEDPLENQTREMRTALCYALLDREPYKKFQFQLNKSALYAWNLDSERNVVSFTHFVEYNDDNRVQTMYPCYGRNERRKQNWRFDEYLKQLQISTGSRPNSYFVYSLAANADQVVYTIHEFVENLDITKLRPIEIKWAEVETELTSVIRQVAATNEVQYSD